MRHIALVLLVFSLFSACRKNPEPDPSQPAVTNVQSESGQQYYTGLIHKAGEREGRNYMAAADVTCDTLPAEFDLRPLGVVPDIRDQGACGSCWAFSKTGSLESAMMGVGKTLNLSEQELVSCDQNEMGCGGGNMDGFGYQISHGQGLETAFPYTASDSRCRSIPVAAKGISYQYIGTANRGPTEKELMCALYKFHTIPWVTVAADNTFGNAPSSELTPIRNSNHGQTNHAVGTVGWHTIGGKVYFILKNSWGTSWGDKGYGSIALGADSFADEAGFIQVEQPTPPPPPPAPTPVPPPPPPPPTPPGPCEAAKVKLPAEVQYLAGTEVMLGVAAQAGVSYSWYVDGVLVPGVTESMYFVVPTKDAVYKLQGKNSCSTAESQTRVRQVMSK